MHTNNKDLCFTKAPLAIIPRRKEIFFSCLRDTAIMAGPLIGSRVGGTITSFISMIMIARLGHTELAAGALINSVLFSILVPLWMLFLAVGILIGHSYGANQPAEIGKVIRQGLLLSIIIGLPFMLLLYWLAPILIFFGQDKQLSYLTQQFYRAYCLGLIPSFWYSCLIQFMLGISRQKLNLFFTFLIMPVMTFLGYTLIFGKFGFSAYRISGMGYANSISYVLIDAIIIGYLLLNKSFRKYNLLAWDLKNNFHYLKEILNIGWPITLMMASELIIFSLSIIFIGWLGETSLAAQQISLQINLVAFMIPMGIGQASTILISQQLGRKNFHLVRPLGYTAMLLTLIATIITLLIYLYMPKLLIGLYINTHASFYAATINLAIMLLFVTGVMNIFDGIRCVAVSALRGLRDTITPMLIFVVLGAVLTLPSGYILAVTMHLGAVGYRYGFVIGFGIGAIILIHRFHKLSAINFITSNNKGN